MIDYFEDMEGLCHDIQERDPKLKRLFKNAEQEALQELSTRFNMRSYKKGYRRAFWNEKKRILREKYDIDWKTLEEMNPDVRFD